MSREQGHRTKAGQLLTEAAHVVLKDRGNQHGGAEDSFKFIADLWTNFIIHSTQHRKVGGSADVAPITYVRITPSDVAQMMVMMKIARSVHGDPTNADNYVDMAGYASLAGAIEGANVDDLKSVRLARDKAKTVAKAVEVTDAEIEDALKGGV